MTVREAIKTGEAHLARAGIETAELDAALLLSHLLDVPHLELWLKQAEKLRPGPAEKFRRLIERRASREPLQHITGWTSFLGLDLHVNRDVLIPRPETEVLAQTALGYLQPRPSPVAVLDWGTGSGCLALALARALPEAEIVALDVSPEALRTARANATAHRLADRIRFVEGPGLAALRREAAARPLPGPFDAIVTNPPYVPSTEIASLQPEVRDHDPRLALDGGPDGLDCFRELAAEASEWLKPDGLLLAEFGDGQTQPLIDVFAFQGWRVVSVEKDLSGRERILIVAPPRF